MLPGCVFNREIHRHSQRQREHRRPKLLEWGNHNHAMEEASYNGHVGVLEKWWSFICGIMSLMSQVGMEHREVLDWDVLDRWKTSGLQLKYISAMDGASTEGPCCDSRSVESKGLPVRLGTAMDQASFTRKLDVLDWWKISGLELT
ncbi:hypothetical protein BJ742DRAFT_853875 [Cladochytrium replicatum]|nr:hypothetical protein BJ742DRAFT_853875 [Cladochytrium replicatum]